MSETQALDQQIRYLEKRLREMSREIKDRDLRIDALEDFHYRVKLGQRWFICGLVALGSVVGFVSYLMNILAHWTFFGLK